MDFSLYSALHGNSPIKYAWRMKNKSKDKWYIIYAKTLETKQEWMDAFRRERTRVLEDHDKGMLYHYTKIIVVRLCVCLSVSNGRTPEMI